MTDQERKAMEMALDVLLNEYALGTERNPSPYDTIKALEAALAQPEQEPVWCGCGDGIVADDGAKCGVCVMQLQNQIERLKAQPEQEKGSTLRDADPRLLLGRSNNFTKETENRLCDIERRLAAIETQPAPPREKNNG